jgi:hypothetical protein
MHLSLDETRSLEIAQQIKSKGGSPFDNAYRAALLLNGAVYVQGFVVAAGTRCQPIEHAWLELDASWIDPTFLSLNRAAKDLYYFPAHKLGIKALKATVEESQEDYPDDDPLPIYGVQPYEYYGDVMLGGKDYLTAYQAAEAKCRELNAPKPNGAKEGE